MNFIIKFCIIIICGALFFSDVEPIVKRVQYLSPERPKVTYINYDYVTFVNMSSYRYSRQDPLYYVQVHIKTQVVAGNNYTIHMYVYEFLSNQYKRSFIEMHIKICDLIYINKMFSNMLSKFFPPTCPIPKGEYHLYNMSLPFELVPKHFPFTKGRLYSNITDDKKNLIILSGYLDLELKTIKI